MWTGNQPPPLPQTRRTTPKKVRRPNAVAKELEALRQRGLATLLNKHFTEETKKLAAEKAAADAALADLLARKAQTGEFKASGDGEISPFDHLYLSVTKWRNECRQKERETLLLYQRYVDKFGSTGQVQVPMTACNPNAATTTPRNSNSPTLGLAVSPAVSEESLGSPVARPPPPTPPSVQVPSMAKAIESNLEDYLKSGAVAQPSVSILGKEETYAGAFDKSDAAFRNYYRRQLEAKTPDAKASKPEMVEEYVYTGPGFCADDAPLDPNAFLRTIGESVPEVDNDDDEEEDGDGLGPLNFISDNDSDTVISGLTFNSALTREILDDCERTVATFLHEEQEAIRKMMNQEYEEPSVISAPSELGSVSKQAADQAETMVKQMQEILDNFKATDGTPVGEDATAEESGTSAGASAAHEAREYPTANPDEKWMVYYDTYYKKEYYHELNSNRTQWEAPDRDNTSASDEEEQLMPENGLMTGKRPISRIEKYRRRRRRQRKRRIIAAAFTTLALLLGSVYYLHSHPETVPSKMYVVALAMPVLERVVDRAIIDEYLDAAVARAQKTIEWALGESQAQREAREVAERALVLERQKLAELQAKQEKERVAKQAAMKKAAEEKARKEKLAKEAALRKAKEEARLAMEAHLARQEAERLHKERALAMRRRLGGNVPFAYFIEDLPMLTKYQ